MRKTMHSNSTPSRASKAQAVPVRNVESLRPLPLAAGISGLGFVLLNRFLSGVS